jgi:hypothetical protein
MRRLPPAALAITLALALPGCGRPAPQTRFLNFDPESSSGALTSGWSGFETTGEGDTFSWAQAKEVRATVVAGPPADRLVRFRTWPFRWEGAPPQTVAVAVNGVQLAAWTLSDGARVYSATSPAAAWQEGPNVLSFRFTYAEAPKDRIPGNEDSRTLAAAFDWVEIVPVPAAPDAGQ